MQTHTSFNTTMLIQHFFYEKKTSYVDKNCQYIIINISLWNRLHLVKIEKIQKFYKNIGAFYQPDILFVIVTIQIVIKMIVYIDEK